MGITEQQQKITVLVLLHLRQPQIRLVHGDAVEALAGLGDGRGVLVEEGGAGRALGLGRVGVQGNVDHGRGVRVYRGLAVDKLVEALVDASSTSLFARVGIAVAVLAPQREPDKVFGHLKLRAETV
jgi:hypothetical protein